MTLPTDWHMPNGTLGNWRLCIKKVHKKLVIQMLTNLKIYLRGIELNDVFVIWSVIYQIILLLIIVHFLKLLLQTSWRITFAS